LIYTFYPINHIDKGKSNKKYFENNNLLEIYLSLAPVYTISNDKIWTLMIVHEDEDKKILFVEVA